MLQIPYFTLRWWNSIHSIEQPASPVKRISKHLWNEFLTKHVTLWIELRIWHQNSNDIFNFFPLKNVDTFRIKNGKLCELHLEKQFTKISRLWSKSTCSLFCWLKVINLESVPSYPKVLNILQFLLFFLNIDFCTCYALLFRSTCT